MLLPTKKLKLNNSAIEQKYKLKSISKRWVAITGLQSNSVRNRVVCVSTTAMELLLNGSASQNMAPFHDTYARFRAPLHAVEKHV